MSCILTYRFWNPLIISRYKVYVSRGLFVYIANKTPGKYLELAVEFRQRCFNKEATTVSVG